MSSKAQKWWDSRQPEDRTCCYCHRAVIRPSRSDLSGKNNHNSEASIDHDIPKCRIGYVEKRGSNTVLSCFACNQAKGDMTGDEFIHFLRSGEILPSYINWIAEKMKKRLRSTIPGMVLRGGFWVEK
jgi:hypothetical protein